ncbi:syntaxin binding protein 6 (amisyn), like isoform X1 [Synchiropus splendidus]|uniref:syntaxin binding protein 6 (amisyn), like isoform X1 n=3 Tax=Synchiropus splendidus TaxID=270530 RepID=UPI00237E311B|nr:syntaxin binding protein 6 (amisyn), like isoform X1 [Synchiropus splendidus]
MWCVAAGHTMSIQSAINKEIFIPHDERLLVAVEVWRRKRKRMSFLPPAGERDYSTFICVSVSNTQPHQLLITKVKQYAGAESFRKRSKWSVDQLRQVNGINPNKDSPEFDLVFDSETDQWVARSSAEKCIFIQILYHACQTYWAGKLGKPGKLRKPKKGKAPQSGDQQAEEEPMDNLPTLKALQSRRKSYAPPKQTEFINCQSKLTADACAMTLVIYRCKAFINRMKSKMAANQSRSKAQAQLAQSASVVQRVSVALGERGQRLTKAEDKTVELLAKAQQFADATHKLALKYSK